MLKHMIVAMFLLGSVSNAVATTESQKPEDCLATQTHGRHAIPEKKSSSDNSEAVNDTPDTVVVE